MVSIYSVHYNRPDFIEKQIKSFNKHLKVDYKFTVIDNSESADIREACRNTSTAYLKNEYPVKETASKMHCSGLALALELICKSNEISIILDHDMFLCKDLDTHQYTADYDIAFFLHTYNDPIHYIWPGIIILNPLTLPALQTLSLNVACIQGINCDSGAESYYYLQQYKDTLRIKYMTGTPFSEHLQNEAFYTFDETFLHYFRGSNWINHDISITAAKDERLNRVLDL